MAVLAVSTVGAILIVVGCVALLAIAGGLIMGGVQGRAAQRADPLGDPIETPDFKRPRDEGDLL
jgi:hypothetical protein